MIDNLQAPFEPNEIEWRVGSTTQDKTKGMALAYVTNRAIQNRLDNVFGVFGWKNEFKAWGDKSQLCGISAKDENGEWITKWDGAENTDFEATKGGLSDSMKRAACQWGIGRYLYKLDAVWVPIKQQGKSYVIEKGNEPKLPAWALPSGLSAQPPKQAPRARTDTRKKLSDEQVSKLIEVAGGAESLNSALEKLGVKSVTQIAINGEDGFSKLLAAVKSKL